MTFGVYHKVPKTLARLIKVKKTSKSAALFAAECALGCNGVFVVVDWQAGKEIFTCEGQK
jgi:hypothetical protein